jgi:hypothetical protein
MFFLHEIYFVGKNIAFAAINISEGLQQMKKEVESKD